MKAWLKHAQPLVLATAAAVVFGACDEQLDGGAACPLLCPQQQVSLRDTTFFAVEMDTAIAGFPSLGAELLLFLASFGDTLQTRGVVRYDSLAQRFTHNNSATDSAIVSVDTGSIVRFTVVRGDTLGPSGTVELYDVDLGGAEDADPTAVSSAFTADRILGSGGFTAKDTLVNVPIDPGKLLAKIQATPPANRLRIGVRVSSSASVTLTVRASDGGSAPQLTYRPAAGDTSVPLTSMSPRSLTPAERFTAAGLVDYLVVTKAPPDSPPDVMRVGGLPGQRAYFRFNIPSRILDSSNVVRATFLLTQRPNGYSPTPRDSVALEPFAVSAGPTVTDLSKALLFLVAPAGTDSVKLVAADSGVRAIEMIRIIKLWSSTAADKTPRALVLRAAGEGQSGKQIDFFSLEAPLGVRPKLRITYLPRQEGGLP